MYVVMANENKIKKVRKRHSKVSNVNILTQCFFDNIFYRKELYRKLNLEDIYSIIFQMTESNINFLFNTEQIKTEKLNSYYIDCLKILLFI